MSIQSVRRILTPRALEHWTRAIGFGNRLEIHLAQCVKVSLRVLSAATDRLEPALAVLESRIHFLQADQMQLRTNLLALSSEVAHYKKWFNQAPIGFHIINSEGIITTVNQHWLDLLGYAREEVIGHSIFDFIVYNQRENARARFIARLNGKPLPPKAGERQYLTKDGRIIFIETVDAISENGNGKSVQTSFQDITARVVAQKALESANLLIIEQERRAAVGDWVYVVSHTYKNQVAVLSGMIDNINGLESQLKTHLETVSGNIAKDVLPSADIARRTINLQIEIGQAVVEMQKQIGRMDAVIKGLLRFSRIGLEEKTVIGVKEQVYALVLSLIEIANEKEILIKTDVRSLSPNDGVLISENGFRDILTNLIKNAIEAFGPSGEEMKERNIEVIATRTKMPALTKGAGAEEIEAVMIVITDNGPGIDPTISSDILTRPVPSSKTGGTGLGLSIVAKQVEAANGRITVSSTLGSGTQFTILLPLSQYTPPPKVPEVPEVPKAPRTEVLINPAIAARYSILLVDDSPDAILIHLRALNKLGFSVTTCASAKEALYILGKGFRPSILLTDQNMPEMTGAQLIERVAEMGSPLPHFIICSGGSASAKDELSLGVRSVLDRLHGFYVEKGMFNQFQAAFVTIIMEIERKFSRT